MENKFDDFQPKTPTEMMLHNEIKRLQRTNYVLMNEKGVNPYLNFKREEAVVNFEPPTVLNLPMAARVLGQIDEQGRLSVDARCYGKGKGQLGFAYYLSRQDMQDVRDIADILMHQHKRFTHEMADLLTKEFECAE